MDPVSYKAEHFLWQVQGKVATVILNRPEKKNPLTIDSYAELRDLFKALVYEDEIKVVIITGSGGNFCSGGDVHEIIGPLVKMELPELLTFTRMTGDLVKAMRACPQIVISSIDGICAGAGACIAMASDLRIGTAASKVAFLFVRVGLAGCDMGACSMLPRIIGHGRAAELLYSGRSFDGVEAERIGFYSKLVLPVELAKVTEALAVTMANGPTFAHALTKKMLNQEWNMGVVEAIDAEAKAQAICMQTKDFERAYQAFIGKAAPKFEGD